MCLWLARRQHQPQLVVRPARAFTHSGGLLRPRPGPQLRAGQQRLADGRQLGGAGEGPGQVWVLEEEAVHKRDELLHVQGADGRG